MAAEYRRHCTSLLFLYYTTSSNDYQLIYPKSQNKLLKNIKKLNKKKERRRLRRARRRALSKELLSKDQALNKDKSDKQVTNKNKSNKQVIRAVLFLLKPLLFNATFLRKAYVNQIQKSRISYRFIFQCYVIAQANLS